MDTVQYTIPLNAVNGTENLIGKIIAVRAKFISDLGGEESSWSNTELFDLT